MKNLITLFLFFNLLTLMASQPTYIIVDTGLDQFFDNKSIISRPSIVEPFYGQDANYSINPPYYKDNGDGTITDLNTGLIWQKTMHEKMSFSEAINYAKTLNLAGYSDWRIPTIKELYSLILFTGKVRGQQVIKPFIDKIYFDQPKGDRTKGEREIDAQTWSCTNYVGRTMRNDETIFGVNFLDGRIKGYPKYNPRTKQSNKMYFRFVRGNKEYGKNRFIDNNDGTISDLATGLMWQKKDSGKGMNWQQALKYSQDLILAGHDDWRLPNAKELQSIVDYSRSPQTTNSPAINNMFKLTQIKSLTGRVQFPYYWTSTTHMDGRNLYDSAVYIAFGEGIGKMHGKIMDVHGAGCQRSDPKNGNSSDYPTFFGPQGDARYVYNHVLSVRNISND